MSGWDEVCYLVLSENGSRHISALRSPDVALRWRYEVVSHALLPKRLIGAARGALWHLFLSFHLQGNANFSPSLSLWPKKKQLDTP